MLRQVASPMRHKHGESASVEKLTRDFRLVYELVQDVRKDGCDLPLDGDHLVAYL